ncbi:MAG: DUF445 domain-containing protein [Proteobacteria bacterium]|nr:DUF445 domain-containing protein [Pseudomonadota bacterium]
MRRLATALLVAMAALFATARHFRGAGLAWEWIGAFAEAAMVGALADWFAVTALFRHPLGLPIPHTAIIPEKKDRIAGAMAEFLRSYFLTPQVVARRLRATNMAGAVGGFLADPNRGGSLRLRAGAAGLLGDLFETLDDDELGDLVKSALRNQLEQLDLAPLLGQLLRAAMADGRHRPLIEATLHWAGLTLEDNEPLLREMIHERANALLKWTGLDERLANTILDGLYRLLAETIVDPQHPLRGKIEEGLESLAQRLVEDPEMQATVARLKAEVLANPAMAAWLDGLWRHGRASLLAMARESDPALPGRLGGLLVRAGTALQDDARLQLMVNRFARRLLVGVASRYGSGIVTLVSDTVRRWDARTITLRIEGAVGRDLQFIRINGTIVGGLVGVALHAAELWM